MIDCQCLFKRRAGRALLAGVNLQVRAGETLVICGPSGAGKTTLLRAINGLEPLDGGSITVGNQAVWPNKRGSRELKGKVGMLFQNFNLFEHLSALENIGLAPRRVLGLSKLKADQRAQALLEELGLADKAHHHPHQLSGGEKQRVALARCLAMEPSVMLLDEPTSALDPARTAQIAELIHRLKRRHVATVVVSHDPQFGYQVADRMLSLASGQLVDLQQDESCCASLLPVVATVPSLTRSTSAALAS